MSDVVDDCSISKKPIPDLERQKFYDDGDKTYVRTVNSSQDDIDETTSNEIIGLLSSILNEIKLSNIYLSSIVGDDFSEDC